MTRLVMHNSRTITDYAFSRHLAPWHGVTCEHEYADILRYASARHHLVREERVTDRDGHPMEITWVTNITGTLLNIFVIEYFTRVPCVDCEYHWAQYYTTITHDRSGTQSTAARCNWHTEALEKQYRGNTGFTVTRSKPLRIGQHD